LVLAPLVLAPLVRPWCCALVLAPLVLAPLVLAPLPLVLKPLVLKAPGAGAPVLAPLLGAPGAAPLVLAPLVLAPLVLKAPVLKPLVLAPLVLAPLVLAPLASTLEDNLWLLDSAFSLGVSMDLRDARIVINVSGTRFETTYSVLERFPGSRLALLATLREDDEAFDRDRREYYFDRHPEVFADILHFYRTEELHIRRNLCGNVIKKEFEFWGMFEQDIEPCCWTSYSQAAECKDTLAAIDSTFLTGNCAVMADVWKSETNQWIRFRRRMWSILEDPAASLIARIYVFVSMFVVVTSIVCFVSETYEAFRVPLPGANLTIGPTCTTACGVYVDPQLVSGAKYYSDDDTEPHPVLRYLDYSMFVFFTLELLMRLFFAPDYRAYFTDFLNWIDIVCVVTHAVSLSLSSIETLPNYTPTLVKTVLTLRVLRGLRVVRVLRIFKLVKHYNAFRILVYTIKISLRELMLMIVFLFVGAVIFGSIIHLVEKDSFRNIPYGLWWALVTMT
uniref:BTB domain-containing protein n=1 Tax=Macrostomum lignano TaxID=282301 RepID=A0A1I8IWW5_9PLAT